MKVVSDYERQVKMKKAFALSVLVMILAGCGTQYRIFDTGKESAVSGKILPDELNTLTAQQFAAYPILEDSDFLTLADFEQKWQLEDFHLSRKSGQTGRAKIFYTDSPTATGEGAMGIFFGTTDDYTVTFDMLIRNWNEYNVFLCAIFCNENYQNAAVELVDNAGHSFIRRYQLRRKWNKLMLDLVSAGKEINLKQIVKVKFHFYQVGQEQIYIDDLILAKHLKVLVGQIGGRPGTVFAAKAGRRLRVGVNGRFELVFAEGKIVGWYDLTTDKHRVNNLAPVGGLGPNIYQVIVGGKFIPLPENNTLMSVHTSLIKVNANRIKIVADIYFGSKISGRNADQTITYYIGSDGMIKTEICTANGSDTLGVGFAVADGQGFDGIVGKIKNPSGPPDSHIEYCLFRRMGKRQGSDLLVAFKPFQNPAKSVECKLIGGRSNLSCVLISKAQPSGSCLTGMIRIWPINIDNIANAERYVRDFIANSMSLSSSMGSGKSAWQPGWPAKLGK